jgi:hypothetical protein
MRMGTGLREAARASWCSGAALGLRGRRSGARTGTALVTLPMVRFLASSVAG